MTRSEAPLYFSDYFEVRPSALAKYGALNVSVVSDLPLFIDPFLLFNSRKKRYQELHAEIIRYLRFLRDNASDDQEAGLLAAWYEFREVRQNWLGYTLFGNGGHGLGPDFAKALNSSLGTILRDFGNEKITKGSHLEKLCLIRDGVGRDNISDFTTNLIKGYLLEFTEKFAKAHLVPKYCRRFTVPKVAFNYGTESWEAREYYLPSLRDDFVLLTPVDLLTRDETWISYPDLLRRFSSLPDAIPNEQLRSQINRYLRSRLGKRPTVEERIAAERATLLQFPQLIDYYIAKKEEDGDRASSVSSQRVAEAKDVFIDQLSRLLVDLETRTDFYNKPWTSYQEARERVLLFKAYVENQDGYKLINRAGRPFSSEEEVHLFFGLAWCKTDFDVNREVNNGRGPVDFKVSYGSGDKSLIEFKLASNTSLKRNLLKQVGIYQNANRTRTTVKVIICYTAADQKRVASILTELKIENEPSIVVIDARSDNKPSASKA